MSDDLLDVLRRKVTRHGIGSLITALPRFLQRYVLIRYVAGEITREELAALPERGGQCWEFGTDETVRIDYPGTRELPESFRRYLGTYDDGKSFVSEVTDATLVGFPDPICLTSDNRIVKEAAGTTMAVHHRVINLLESHGIDAVFKEFRRGTGIEKDGDLEGYGFDTVVPLVSSSGQKEYFHWIVEDLPRLRGFFHYRDQTGREPRIIIRPDPPTWITESLELIGIEPEQWTEWTTQKARARRVVVPQCRFKALPLEPSNAEFRWLRRTMMRNASTAKSSSRSVRIYISRERADSRRVRNRDEVMSILAQFGFESYVLEEMSVPEQVRLFSRAEHVVAPHGSGLTNMLFASDPTVVELLPEDDVRACFFAMARQLDFEYSWLTCEHDSVNDDMQVDTDDLREIVERHVFVSRREDRRAADEEQYSKVNEEEHSD